MIQLFFLGPPRVERDGKPTPPFKSRKVLALLAYLALCPGAHPRSELAGLLWSDCPEQQALDNLRFALWNIRRILGTGVVHADRLTVSLESSAALQVDADIFRNSLATLAHQDAPTRADVAQWARAVGLYRGDLLAGLDLPGDVLFCDWLVKERARWREQAVQALHRLATYHAARHNFATAISATRRLLELDPWREEAHRHLMVLLAKSGQRSAALAQYETCRRVLADELGVEPSPRTTAWHTRIRASDTQRLHNLPSPVTPFVGRANELTQIAARLREPTCRLLTLIGPGGIGKTRLALQAAAQQTDDFLHGVWWVPLAGVDAPRPELLVTAVAAQLSLSFAGSGDPKTQLLNYLSGKELLLILDNFEHLLAGTPLVLEILQRAPEVKILVTSRERLNVQAEWLFDVPGMPVSESGDGTRLFLENARRVGGQSTPDEARSVARICELVDGLPLGIELAAAWTREFSCRAIAAQVEQHLDFLSTSLRDVPARHSSLRAVFDWSWGLLSAEEQQAFRRLAVFRGGIPPDAARSVAGASASVLSALSAKSLLVGNDSGRSEMLQVLRQYAAEKLAAAPEEQRQTRVQHGEWYLAFLRAREDALKGGGQRRALDELNAEIENIRAAWAWAAERGSRAAIAGAANALFLFYDTRNWSREGEQAFASAAEGLRAHGGADLPLGKVLARQGALRFRSAEYAPAEQLLQQALELVRSLDARDEITFALNNLATISDRLGQSDQAKQRLEESLAISRELGDAWGTARALNNLGYVIQLRGDAPAAQAMFEEALALRRAVRDDTGVARTLINLGLLAGERQEFAGAQECYRQALAIFREFGNPLGVAICLNNLGYISQQSNELAQATDLYRQALAIREEVGDAWGIALAYDNLGAVACASGDYTAARNYFHRALQIGLEIRAARRLAEVLVGIAGLAVKQAESERAAEFLGLAINHPAISGESKRIGQQWLATLASQLAPDALAAAIERGRAQDLEEVAARQVSEWNRR